MEGLRNRIVLLAIFFSLVLAACSSQNPYYDPAKPHHRPDGFVNTDPTARLPNLPWWEQLYLAASGYFSPKAPPRGGYDAFARQWSVKPELDWLRNNRSETAITWLGHASVLLQVDGVNILMDPNFSERASPLSWAGPRRMVPAPLQVPELPRIDWVLISHNHYDHLDQATVVALARAQPATRFLVPLGMKKWFTGEGITEVTEIDWWDSVEAGPVRLHLVPVQHWSKRTALDRNMVLWGGYVVQTRGAKPWRFLFTGDTGYSKDFATIRERLGDMDLAALPVGAYEPRDFMRPQHVNPEDALRILLDVNARQALGIHWGTFPLTQEPFDQPPEDLETARKKLGVAPERLFLLRQGETRRITR